MAVMHAEQLEQYRRMTPRERTREMLDLMDMGWRTTWCQGEDHARRCVEAIGRVHRASVDALVEGLERALVSHAEASVP